VDASFRLLGEPSADWLARVAVAVGLAQNLAALRALTQEGILRGHLKLHHRVSALADRG
jgi:hydroxymethylglutaryl-CoA reductase